MDSQQDEEQYRFLVVDSGPIIRLTGLSTLWKKAREFYTVPAVWQEIRDAKARQHLETLPFELKTKDPTAEALQAVIEFSRQTGDYQSLSSVDLQVLALAYDLEREATNGDMQHIRKTPKRVAGVGKVQSLTKDDGEEKKEVDGTEVNAALEEHDEEYHDDDEEDDEEEDDETDMSDNETPSQPEITPATTEDAKVQSEVCSNNLSSIQSKPRSWAALVNPSEASVVPCEPTVTPPSQSAARIVTTALGSMKLSSSIEYNDGGQFSDAEDGQEESCGPPKDLTETGETTLESELASDFPSLAASLHVPYEGSDNEVEEFDEEERKKRSLAPISKTGKLYNSFGKYKKLLQTKPSDVKSDVEPKASEGDKKPLVTVSDSLPKPSHSRIIGGAALAGQEADFDDDGEGWISTVSEIRQMKSTGVLDPLKNPQNAGTNQNKMQGPSISQRAACTTTDFAMQNVILQMNLELLSVDGVKVRKLKSWVQRCGACFKVFTNAENTGPLAGKRLFCDHCGSNMIQRIACSVDSKTGRLRLHLSKSYKHNLRGTKFSLPKPGTNNRFQGDLLLAQDQLMVGAWNQKVKMRSGGKAKTSAQSMFGPDIASNVGCNTKSITDDDIRVGFGRRNPNAAKGRERRGKKKKSGDKACGLRRY